MKVKTKHFLGILVFLALKVLAVEAQELKPFVISSLKDSMDLSGYLFVQEDPTRQLRFSDIRQREEKFQAFSKFEVPLNPKSAYWGKILLKSELKEHSEWVLFPNWGPNLRRNGVVEVFLPKEDTIIFLKSGQYVPASQKAIQQGIKNKIPLVLPAFGQQEIYIRIFQVNGYNPEFSPLLAERYFWISKLDREGWHIFQGFFQGMLWIIILYFTISFLMTRQNTSLYYVAFLITTSIYMLYLSNLIHELILEENPYLIPYIWIITSNILGLAYFQFCRHFLKTWEIVPRWDKVGVGIMRFILVVVVVELLICYMTFNIKLLNEIVNVLILCEVLFLLLVIVFNFEDMKMTTIIFMVGTISIIMAGLVGVVSEIFFNLDNTLPFVEGFFIIQILTISFGLSYQYYQNEKEKLEAQKKMNESLLRADKLKDTFLANTSHEVRTPLHAIVGLSEAMRDQQESLSAIELESNLSLIVSSGKRLAHMVDDILDFSKLKSMELSLNCKPVSLSAIFGVVIKMNAPLAAGKQIRLINNVPMDLPPVWADESRLQQILFNLVGNAIKFTRKGEVKIRARLQGEEVVVSVRDTGIGIPKEKQQVIFEPFEQADGSITREFGGTGLGLTITKSLIELHKGKIWVESAPGKGATFLFTLPVSSQMLEEPVTRPKEVAAVQDAEILQQKEEIIAGKIDGVFHLLIVDDESINHHILQSYLRQEPFQITSAFSGEEALKLLEGERHFDLVLLDVMMPHLSGYETCQRIRQRYLPSELPIIFITAKNQIKDLIQGFDDGANDYLAKPFSRAEFMARLKTHLNLHSIYTSAAKFVPSEFLQSLSKESILDVRLGDHIENNVTVFFSDIRSYTTLAEGMSPNDNYHFVNAYAGRMGPIIKQYNGFVHQYLGDGIMALFLNSPDDAVLASIAMQKKLDQYNNERLIDGRKSLRVGMGMHTGNLVMGIIGDRFRNDPAVISDTVNTASRMEGLTKYFGARIIISEYTLNNLNYPEQFHSRFLGKVQVKGKTGPQGIFEIIDGDPPDIFQKKLDTVKDMEQGLEYYYQRAFELAAVCFRRVLERNAEDQVARQFLVQSANYMVEGVPEDWKGVLSMKQK